MKKAKRRHFDLDATEIRFLLTGKCAQDSAGWQLRVSRFFDGGKKIREVWREHELQIRKQWRGSGRPWAERYIDDSHKALQEIYEKGL